MHSPDDLNAARAPIKKGVQIPGHLSQGVAQRRRRRVKRGKPQSLVALELCYRDETPLRRIQLAKVSVLHRRHPYQLPVVAVCPAVIRAGEDAGVARIGPAQPVAAMAADVEKGMHLSLCIPHHQDRVFAHIRA